MLRRGDSWLILFDAAAETAMDAPLRPGVRHQSIPGGAMLTLDAAAAWAGPWQRARGADGGWLLAPGEPPVLTPAIHAAADAAGALAMLAAGARRVLSVLDPVTGLPLLVGTQGAGGGLVSAPREMVALRLLETRLGVAVLARSDGVVLRAAADRFVVVADGGQTLALSLAPETRVPAPTTNASDTRSFDFPIGDEQNVTLTAIRNGNGGDQGAGHFCPAKIGVNIFNPAHRGGLGLRRAAPHAAASVFNRGAKP